MQKRWDCPLYIQKGHRLVFQTYHVFLSLKLVLTSAKSEDPFCGITSGSSLFVEVPGPAIQWAK